MATPKHTPQKLDPKITALLFKGFAVDVEDGRVEVNCLEKITYAKGETTLVVNYTEQKK